jgi:hypothetical protein
MRRKGEIAIKRERMEKGEAESKWVGAGEEKEERWERRMRNRRWEGNTDVRSSLQKERAGEGGHKKDDEKGGKIVRKELCRGREGEGNVIKKAREKKRNFGMGREGEGGVKWRGKGRMGGMRREGGVKRREREGEGGVKGRGKEGEGGVNWMRREGEGGV